MRMMVPVVRLVAVVRPNRSCTGMRVLKFDIVQQDYYGLGPGISRSIMNENFMDAIFSITLKIRKRLVKYQTKE